VESRSGSERDRGPWRGLEAPANLVTLFRAGLVAWVVVLVADRPVAVAWLVGVAAVALVLDKVDGVVARRTGTASRTGARFDLEVDAFLILVLSVHVALELGLWVLAIGLWRYLFVLAGLRWAWLRRPLPPSRGSKAIASTQGVVLVVAASGLLPTPLTITALALALALLTWSFVRDWYYLFRTAGTTS